MLWHSQNVCDEDSFTPNMHVKKIQSIQNITTPTTTDENQCAFSETQK